MIKMIAFFSILFTSGFAFCQDATASGPCNGKIIYFQVYTPNRLDMRNFLETFKPELTAQGAQVPVIEDQWYFHRETGYPRPKNQVDYNRHEESDKACAEFLQQEIGKVTISTIWPNIYSKTVALNPGATPAGIIVFWWAGRMTTEE